MTVILVSQKVDISRRFRHSSVDQTGRKLGNATGSPDRGRALIDGETQTRDVSCWDNVMFRAITEQLFPGEGN